MDAMTKTYTPTEVEAVAAQLCAVAEHTRVMLFQGPIGAGKTTLIRTFLRQLGVMGPIVSPTFTYVAAYSTAQGCPVYHFDLYRLRTQEAFESLGFSDYLHDPHALILIEWPAIIMPLLPYPVCMVTLDYGAHIDQRTVTIEMVETAHGTEKPPRI